MGVTPRPLELKIEVAQHSDPGRDPNKQINEDSCGHSQTKFGHLIVLCDGMGGHYGGQEASRRAITTIFEQIERAPDGMSPALALKQAVEVAARRVYELGGPPENKVRPGSTVVSMLLHDGGVDVAHVGDSRAYAIRAGQIYPLTRDHSMVQAMIDAGFLTEEQAIGHPDANKITRALGMKPDVEVDLRPEPMELFAGDILLTSSDGLTDLALPKDILGATRQALASGTLDHACQQLVRMANDRGGHDNITVQLVRVVSTGVKRTNPGASPTMNEAPRANYVGAELAMTPPAAAPAGMGMTPAPTTTVPQHAGSMTIPMHPSPTAHDGTSRASFAAAQHAPAAGAHQLPPTQLSHAGAASPTLNQGHGHGESPSPGLVGANAAGANMQGYRLDGAMGLGLPPVSQRHGGPQQGMQQATPAMGVPQPAPSYGGNPGIPAPMPSWAGGPTSTETQGGGKVLYLILAGSFVVACIALLLVWLVFLKS
jgi:protein phosphatase